MLVYMCACRLRLCVRSGLRLRLTHHLSRPPPHHHALPVEDAAGALVISRAGAGCSGERRPLSAVDWRGLALLALLAPIGGWGAFGSPAQGPVRPGVVGCRWSLRACRHGTLGRLHCGCRRSRLRALSALSGWRLRWSLRWFSWGSRALGGLRMFGARVFSVPASCLAGWGCLFPTHTINVYMEKLMTQARSHTQVYTQAFTLVVKTGAHRHPLS